MQRPVNSEVVRAANDLGEKAWHLLRMAQTTKIHGGKQPPRLNYIAEWAERRQIKQSDVADALGADKGTVSRWFAGTIMPTPENLVKLAAFLQLDEVSSLFRHPDEDWMARFLRGREADERQRIISTLEMAFPRKAS